MDGGGTSPLHTWMPLGGEDPSFFELFMVDKLQRAIMPALEHSLQVLANHAAADEDEEQSPDLGGLSSVPATFAQTPRARAQRVQTPRC